jgi:hypothetical protein
MTPVKIIPGSLSEQQIGLLMQRDAINATVVEKALSEDEIIYLCQANRIATSGSKCEFSVFEFWLILNFFIQALWTKQGNSALP